MPRKARDVKSALGGKFGFSPAPVGREKGHEWFALDVPGVARVLTMFSRGMPEFSDDLMATIARQLRVRRGYRDGMIDCTFSSEAYRKKLVDNPDGPLAGGGSRRP